VTLSVEASGKRRQVMFSFDLAYAGVFRFWCTEGKSAPAGRDRCPRLLFPFAREIIATSVRDGGFPPLMLDPVILSVLVPPEPGAATAAQARRLNRS
jgi:preprotein translocase subunit SecB